VRRRRRRKKLPVMKLLVKIILKPQYRRNEKSTQKIPLQIKQQKLNPKIHQRKKEHF